MAAVMLAVMWPRLLLVVPVVTVVNLLLRIATAEHVGRALVGSFREVAPLVSAGLALAAIDDEACRPITAPLREDVPALRRLRGYARWATRDRTAAAAGGLGSLVLEYLNLLFILDLTLLYFAAREIRAHGPALLRVIAAVGDVDAAISIASYRTGTPHWTRPRFLPAGSPIVLADLRHPLVASAVPNSITLGPPHGILVTGSNMSGKTTFVRTLGVAAVLAQTINTCLATAYDAPVLHVRSCIGRADDLLHGKSYYLVEVEAVMALVEASRSVEQHLFLFDELFRGTNAVERIAVAEAVLQELLANQTHVVVAATHDGELVRSPAPPLRALSLHRLARSARPGVRLPPSGRTGDHAQRHHPAEAPWRARSRGFAGTGTSCGSRPKAPVDRSRIGLTRPVRTA